VDLTGYWVSLITEDWRFRMATPPKGDFTSRRHLSRSRAARWIAESRDDWPEAGIPTQERRSVQRRNVPYGVLRSIRSAKRQKFLGVMEGYTRVNIERRKL
jgi:hypothetical protein